MNAQAIRLSIHFFKEIKGIKEDGAGRITAPEHYKHMIMSSIEQILQGGMKPQELEQLMNDYKEAHNSPEQTYSIEDMLKYMNTVVKKEKVERDPNNLLESGKFYYHPMLQVSPPPPVVVQLPDGTFESSYDTEEFFLEMKESFTVDNLVDYFYKSIGEKKSSFKERDIGAFKHMLRGVDLEVILFAIDESMALAYDLNKPLPKSPFDIREYLDGGLALLEDRKNTCYMEGLDRVIPRNII